MDRSVRTRINDSTPEDVVTCSGVTRDLIILVREASHRAICDELRSVDLWYESKDYKISVKVTR